MKVEFNNESKKSVFVSELDAVKLVQQEMKEFDHNEDIRWFINRYFDYGASLKELYSFKARIARNERMDYNRICEGSGKLDVWCEFKALTDKGFMVAGYYVSDLWDGQVESHWSVRLFKEC